MTGLDNGLGKKVVENTEPFYKKRKLGDKDDKKYLIMFFISMVPLIELRGAIPYAALLHVPILQAFIISIIGNMLPVPVIFWFARKVLMWGKRQEVYRTVFYLVHPKRRKKRRTEADGKDRRRSVYCVVAVCRNPIAGNRSMDRYACCKFS